MARWPDAAVTGWPPARQRQLPGQQDYWHQRAIAKGSCLCVVPSLSNRDGSGGIRQQKAAASGDTAGTAVRASLIQTLTVGTGISPVQPSAGSFPERKSTGSRVADCHRRFGLTPTPEHVLCVAILTQPRACSGYSPAMDRHGTPMAAASRRRTSDCGRTPGGSLGYSDPALRSRSMASAGSAAP